ncbi:hypothetical protein GTCCBUS3UF5_10520 [Geobacillus thermoleovorans CCB_US3_UF5]|uniref:Uncharacterized protein n=2 Tax=Geobacillus thermoleovorans group TaxID=1505648 RepID=U2Y2N4_GEOKU|nr:hypothetical protein GTCCBUS3UF5_10520 [Geobacillus thermoleovorans CCB_US3_UF5]GAD13384.1 hypothetical protein GBL_1601 [Geobacillus kaustophilus GBlys]GAJ59797.1 hypothetical protein B23_3022 [Geobacillus thermoleovorans B23]
MMISKLRRFSFEKGQLIRDEKTIIPITDMTANEAYSL